MTIQKERGKVGGERGHMQKPEEGIDGKGEKSNERVEKGQWRRDKSRGREEGGQADAQTDRRTDGAKNQQNGKGEACLTAAGSCSASVLVGRSLPRSAAVSVLESQPLQNDVRSEIQSRYSP